MKRVAACCAALAVVLALADSPLAQRDEGVAVTSGEATHLALPAIQLGGWAGGSGALLADPTFSSLWELTRTADSVAGVQVTTRCCCERPAAPPGTAPDGTSRRR